jgi:parallel beta-helix repeat protein
MILKTFEYLFRRPANKRPARPLALRGFKPKLEALEDRRLLSINHTFTVDGNVAHHANFTTIQAAVNAAVAGDTIKVAPGLYDEAVNVNKSLTIIGAQWNKDVRTRLVDAAHESIVEVPDSSAGFNLAANNIIVEGFTIRPQAGATTDADGITTNALFSGEQVLNNIFAGDTIGLYLNSNGVKPDTVSGNSFKSNNFAGAASGNAIYSDQGLKNATISKNFFTGDLNASVILVGGDGSFGALSTHSNVQIVSNVMTNDAPIIMINTINSKISGNQITNPDGSGIFFGGGVTKTEVSGNTLKGNAASFTGINLRTDPLDYTGLAIGPNGAIPNSGDKILNNTVIGFGDSGIRLREGTNGVTVQGNTLQNNGTGGDPTTGDGISVEDSYSNTITCNTATGNRRDGIRLSDAQGNTVTGNNLTKNLEDGIQLTAGSKGNTVSSNTLKQNTRDGIRVDDAASTNNSFTSNNASQNGQFDYFDITNGSGTAGTGNIWKKNIGKTQNRPGLKS